MKPVRYAEKKESFWTRKKVYTLLMGLFFISLMVFSVLYYGLDNTNQKKVTYRGLTFSQTSLGWQAYTDDNQRILLQSDPSTLDAENISSTVDFSFVSSLQKIYMSFNPEDDVSAAITDFQQNKPGSASLAAACYEDSEPCAELPLKTCEDATSTVGVILLKQGDVDTVSLDGNCLVIEGKNLLTIVDQLVVETYV